jgi:molybdopterin/thiamine biosynthesis adenylyltransferase
VQRERARLLLVGVGGLGCPAAIALAGAGIGALGLCDDDEVERTNLHRQILFAEADVGAPKVDAAARALARRAPELQVNVHRTRLLPDNAVELVRGYDLVLEGADNFATKFLVADACLLAGVPVVHASAVRWVGTALAVSPRGGPCYRCLFEDVPAGDDAPNCAEAGVLGPVVGVVAAAQVDLAIAWLDGAPAAGELATFDGRTGSLRRHAIPARRDCPLCGTAPRIRRIAPETYAAPACAG